MKFSKHPLFDSSVHLFNCAVCSFVCLFVYLFPINNFTFFIFLLPLLLEL